MEGAIRISQEERFWRRADTSGGVNACWPWSGAKLKSGYGRFRTGGVGSFVELSHRMAYKLGKGHLSDEAYCCHTCDNPECVNPSHLFAGTHSNNMRDMLRKGRGRWQ